MYSFIPPLDRSTTEPYNPPMEESNIIPMYRTKWNDRLALDVALTLEGSGDPMAELLNHYNLTADDMRAFSTDPVFKSRVKQLRDDVRENGLGFKLKARAQAEELLGTSWSLIHDYGVSPAVKADLIKSTVKWAGLEPKGDAAVAAGGGVVRISINLNGNQGQALAIGAIDGEYNDDGYDNDDAA